MILRNFEGFSNLRTGVFLRFRLLFSLSAELEISLPLGAFSSYFFSNLKAGGGANEVLHSEFGICHPGGGPKPDMFCQNCCKLPTEDQNVVRAVVDLESVLQCIFDKVYSINKNESDIRESRKISLQLLDSVFDFMGKNADFGSKHVYVRREHGV